VRLQEGPEGVAQVLRLLGSSGKQTLKELARAARLPVPVLAAIRHELEARGVLLRDAGLRLSPLGEELLRELGGPWVPAACPACEGRGTVIPERYHPVLHALERLWTRRPEVDVRLDQSFALPESNLRRALFALDRGAVLGKRVLFLGDDDAGSIAVALLARELGSEARVAALDVDTRVLDYLRAAAGEEGPSVEFFEHDVREPLPDPLRGGYDTVLTDPPYTLPGLELFLSRALEATGGAAGAQVFLSFGHRPPGEAVRALEALSRLGLALRELRPGFNRYEGASVLGGTSDLYHLVAAEGARPSVAGSQVGGLYTGELRPHTRVYICGSCGTSYKVGPGQEWQTIEALKAVGCPRCGGHRFRQQRVASD
jgi:predicted methyltransferase/DNA-directed RNA polymerase subunit RPC12/RpoP